MQTQPEWGVTAQPRGASMKREIIAFATTMFPEADTLTALEMLLLVVSATLDDVLFAKEDEVDPLMLGLQDDTDDPDLWDYCF